MATWHSHVGIVVGDMAKALPFYTDVLGFTSTYSKEMVPNPQAAPTGRLDGVHYRIEWMRHGDFQIELIDYINKKRRVLDMGAMDVHSTHIGFFAEDIQKHHDRIKAHDIWFRSPPIFWGPSSATTYGKDPDGNWFQLMLPVANNPRAALPLDESGFGHSHAGVIVNRMENALPFYRDLMGMEVVKVTERKPDAAAKGTHLDGVSLTEIWVRKGNFIIELVDFHNKKDRTIEMHPLAVHFTHIAFFTDDLVADYQRLASKGVWFLHQPYDHQGKPQTSAYGKDPDGNWFELMAVPDDARGKVPRG